MKLILISIFIFFASHSIVIGQIFNNELNKDTLLQAILKDLSEVDKVGFLQTYEEMDEQGKEFILFMLSMPQSSKKELISNIDTNFESINHLKKVYFGLVPSGYVVSIEFNEADKFTDEKESVDLSISDVRNQESVFQQEWKLEFNSEKLSEMIKPIGWTNETLLAIKKLLLNAKCISIENGEITTIGFARSGMGKYFFKIFNNDLTNEQIEQYNDGCTYIFYKKNIVLEYGGGAIGPQCFPD